MPELQGIMDMERAWQVVFTCVLTALTGGVIALLKQQLAEARESRSKAAATRAATNEALKYLLKDRILQACQHWQSKGFIPQHSREALTDMVDVYHALGGNSFVTGEYEATMRLPDEGAARMT